MRRRGSAWGQCPDQACGVSAFLHPGTPGAQGRPADLPRARTWGQARSRSGHVRSRGGCRGPRRLGSGASPLPAAAVSAPHPAPPRATHPRWGLPGRGRRGRGSGKGGRRRRRLPTCPRTAPSNLGWKLHLAARAAFPHLRHFRASGGRAASGSAPRATCPRPTAPLGFCPNSRTSLLLKSQSEELIPLPACAPAHLEEA